MNLVEVLNKKHSLTQRNKILDYIGSSPKRFAELIEVFFAGPYRITQRASWPLSYCVERHPELVKPHLKRLVKNLNNPGLHDAVRRNTLRLMQFITIPKNLQGEVAQVCFEFLVSKKEPIAVKVFAMSVLGALAEEQPELANELIPIIEDQMAYQKPAFISRGRKLLRKLKQQTQ